MASLPAAGMISLSESLGHDGYGSAKIIQAFTMVEGDKLGTRLPKPKRHIMSADSTEKIQVFDLNIKELAQATG